MRRETVRIRRLAADDSREGLTTLLHRACADLARRGMRYVASHQDVEVTRRRIAQAECYCESVLPCRTL